MNKNKILLVEDSDSLGYILQEYLELHGFRVSWAKNGDEGYNEFVKAPADLCILDVMMPEKDGFTLAAEIKALHPRVPLLFLTAKTLKIDKLKGFHLGADDYIVKPVDEEELLVRIQAVLKRAYAGGAEGGPQSDSMYQIGGYHFDAARQTLEWQGKQQYITEKEAQILQLLCQRKNQVLKRSEALTKLWGVNDYFSRRAMDVHISKLRKYLSHDSRIRIVNLHNQGFILSEQEAHNSYKPL